MFVALSVIILAIVVSASGSPAPVAMPGCRSAAVACGVVSVVLTAWTIGIGIGRQVLREGVDLHRVLRRYYWLRVFHGFANLAFYVWTVFLLNWPAVVQGNGGLWRTVCLDEFFILLPFLVATAGSWAGFYEVDRGVRERMARLASKPAVLWSRWRYVEYQLRHGIAIVLVPVFVVLGTIETLDGVLPRLDPDLALLGLLGGLLLVFPLILRLIWRARPLPEGPLRQRLESLGRRIGVRARDILVWETDGHVANAAVVGFLPRLRYVLLSDGLLANLSEDEIEAVFGHEAGHIKHRHLTQRLLSFIPLWIVLGWVLPPWERGIPVAGIPAEAVRWGGQLAVMGGYMLVVFGYFSRRLERQADVFGCRVSSCGEADCPPHGDGAVGAPPTVLCPTSVRTFVGMLNKLADVNGFSRSTPSWQHFSIARRTRFLESLLDDPGAERRFLRSLRRLHLVLGLVIALLGGCATWVWLNGDQGDRSAKAATTTMPASPPMIAPRTAPETS